MAMPQRDNMIDAIKRLEPPSRVRYGGQARCWSMPSCMAMRPRPSAYAKHCAG